MTTALGPWADGTWAYYAMGWFVGGPWTEPALVHPGNAPDSSAMIVLLPERGWAVAAVTNATHELPAAPPVVDRLSRNAVDIVVGDKPVAAGSLRAFYAVFDLGALLLLAGAGWSLGRAVRMVRRRARPRRGPSILAIAASLLGAVLLLQLPATVGYGWGAAWVWLPDLTLVVGLLVLILAANAFIRGCALWYWRRRTAPI